RVVRHMETAATRHANKIDVKRDSKGPQSYAYDLLPSDVGTLQVHEIDQYAGTSQPSG
ncbi:hypothetical protein ABIC09_007403, partial [Bradyrhizobium sp. S3.12.5]